MMNFRWQQYNEQREEYVHHLVQRNVELEQALVNRGHQLSLAQQEHIDQILLEQRQKLDMVNEEKTMVLRICLSSVENDFWISFILVLSCSESIQVSGVNLA